MALRNNILSRRGFIKTGLIFVPSYLTAGAVISPGPIMRTINTGNAYLIEENFEGTGTPSGWTTGGTGTIDFDYATSPLEGSQSLQLVNASGADLRAVKTFTSSSGTIWMYWIMRNAPNNRNLVYLRDATDSTTLARVGSSGLAWQLTHGSVTDVAEGTFATASTYHCWLEYTESSGANDGVLNLYTSSNATRPGSPTASMVNGNGTAQAGAIRLAISNNGTMEYDKARVSESEIGSNPP